MEEVIYLHNIWSRLLNNLHFSLVEKVKRIKEGSRLLKEFVFLYLVVREIVILRN